jgi:hypothetical protein
MGHNNLKHLRRIHHEIVEEGDPYLIDEGHEIISKKS